MSLSGGTQGGPHVVIIQTMFRLLEDSDGSVILGDLKLIAVGAIKFDQSSLGNVGKGWDICNPVRAVPYLPVAGNGAAQFSHSFASLSVDRQAPSFLMNVSQEVRVGECVGGQLTVQENPLLGDSATIDAILGLERCTPVLLIFAQKEVRIVVAVISFVLDGIEQLLCCHCMLSSILRDICDLYVGAGHLVGHLGVFTEGSDVAELVAISTCHFCVPLLRFSSTVGKSCPFIVARNPRVGVVAFPLGEVVIGLCDSLGPFILARQGSIFESSDHVAVTIRVGSQN
jgi:hypothetical protein